METCIHLNSVDDTRKLGALLGAEAEALTVIGVSGNLGAGKTTLTQALGEELGIAESVNSPTFLMFNEYHSGRLPLYHFDLYRLQEDLSPDSSAMQNLKAELDEILCSGAAIVVVEWIELWEQFLAEYDELRINLSYAGDARRARISARGETATQLLGRINASYEKILPPA